MRKIYVKELPKHCDSCDIYKYYLGCCLTEFSRTTPKAERHNKCPLKSLAEHDKQVRKEVCWDIWKEFEQRLMGKKDDMAVMKVANMINSVLGKIGEKE